MQRGSIENSNGRWIHTGGQGDFTCYSNSIMRGNGDIYAVSAGPQPLLHHTPYPRSYTTNGGANLPVGGQLCDLKTYNNWIAGGF